MRGENSRSSDREELEIAYTDKSVSGWGGLAVMGRYIDRLGLRELLAQALPDGRTSPNRTPAVEIVLAFFATVLTGGKRFAHVERLRTGETQDEVVSGVLGIARMPSAMTLTRYFGGFARAQVEHLTEALWNFTVSRLSCPALGAVLDLDSTVFERYGRQEGSLKGYNPKRRGRPSHHPILAMLAEAKMVLHMWLRSGNSGTARGVEAFLAETLAKLPETFRLYAVRADSGFFAGPFLDDLERRELPYAVVARMTRPVRLALASIRTWTGFGPGLDAAETSYQAQGWKRPRRIVVVRESVDKRPQARGRTLFEMPDWRFHAVVTTLPHPPADVWRFYNGRAECENRLKELKEDFGADGFCLQSFDGTEAGFRLICFLYNLVAQFKSEIVQDPKPRLSTLRTSLFVTGGILGRNGRRRILRLGLRGRYRERFDGLLARASTIPRPTVAHLANPANSHAFPPPRPWKPRPSKRPIAPDWKLRRYVN